MSARGNTLETDGRVVRRTRGHRGGPGTRLMSQPDLSEVVRPFVPLDYFDANGSSMGNGFDMRPYSGIATIAWILEGRGGFLGQRGPFVATVGLDKAAVRAYPESKTGRGATRSYETDCLAAPGGSRFYGRL
jgi:hypothetical protein